MIFQIFNTLPSETPPYGRLAHEAARISTWTAATMAHRLHACVLAPCLLFAATAALAAKAKPNLIFMMADVRTPHP